MKAYPCRCSICGAPGGYYGVPDSTQHCVDVAECRNRAIAKEKEKSRVEISKLEDQVSFLLELMP